MWKTLQSPIRLVQTLQVLQRPVCEADVSSSASELLLHFLEAERSAGPEVVVALFEQAVPLLAQLFVVLRQCHELADKGIAMLGQVLEVALRGVDLTLRDEVDKRVPRRQLKVVAPGPS